MKNVKTRILVLICGLVSVSLLALGITSILLNFQTTSGVLEQTMRETAKITAERVSSQLSVHKTVVTNAGLNADICNPYATLEQKQRALDEVVSEYPDFTRGNILDTDGTSIFNDTNYSDRDYYQNAMKGLSWVSEPLVSRVTGAVTIIVSAPIWQDGIANTTVIGVVYFVPSETFLNDIVSGIKISKDAGAVIINKIGTTIAHPNMERVASYANSQELEKTDSAYAAIAALERRAMRGEIGFGSYSMMGVKKFMAFAPIPDSDGWSIGVNAPISDFMSYTNTSIAYTVIMLVVFLVIAVILAMVTAGQIGGPLNDLAEILSSVAKTGSVEMSDLHRQKTTEMLKRKDEIHSIAQATDSLITMLSQNAALLGTIARGDLTVAVEPLSKKDVLGNAMLEMTSSLNKMLAEMNQASLLVSDGARQIATGSQSLALGSTEQAAAVEQLSGSMTQIAEKTKTNAEMAEKAAALASTVMENAEKGNHQMNEMMVAVREINEAGHSISNVIRVIDDIAFQTNILALNAAVEAARAGQHGKGFAVVAEEVRSLASKSAAAAKDTGNLIANSIEKAELGAHIAGETASSLHEIVSGIGESTRLVVEIAESSADQSSGIAQINRGIEQVARVVQQNTATAEESAAASQEMSGQSDILQSLVARFKIKRGDNSGGMPSLYAAVPVSDAGQGDYGKY